jgi:hypothetical protein
VPLNVADHTIVGRPTTGFYDAGRVLGGRKWRLFLLSCAWHSWLLGATSALGGVWGLAMQDSSVFARDAQGTNSINREAEWQEKTNAAYQDAMKTVLSLATASLILPIVLVKTFASGGVPKDHITQSAYISWCCSFFRSWLAWGSS